MTHGIVHFNNHYCQDCPKIKPNELPTFYSFAIFFFFLYGISALILKKNFNVINDLIFDLSKMIEDKGEFEIIF